LSLFWCSADFIIHGCCAGMLRFVALMQALCIVDE
jgi:hypothetical protein